MAASMQRNWRRSQASCPAALPAVGSPAAGPAALMHSLRQREGAVQRCERLLNAFCRQDARAHGAVAGQLQWQQGGKGHHELRRALLRQLCSKQLVQTHPAT